TCTAMSGNGWRTAGTIAMREIHPPTARRGQQEATATSGSFAAVPGAAGLRSSPRPAGGGTKPATRPTAWASGSAGRLPLESLPLYLWGPGGEAPWTLPRRAAVFVDKIIKGTNPDDIPVEQSTKFATIINLRTAKALGLEVPPTLLARAQ